jgi:multidrug efflux pump subunit AcrB
VGIEVDVINYQPADVVAAVSSFVVSFGQAIAIVVVVLLLFMGLRSGLLIGVVLTLTVLATMILIYMLGVNLERISLGALVIALGMLVDNAIVVTEGMMIRIQSGMDRLKAAKETVGQALMPLLGATVIAVLAFAAIGVSEDATGEYCRSLFQVLLCSLMISWVIAITITPLFCTMFLKGVDKNAAGEAKDPYQGIVFTGYKKLLTTCIRFRWTTVLVLIALLVGSYALFGKLKNNFFPDSTRAQFILNYRLPAGSDIRQTSEDMAVIEQFLLNDERVKSTASYIGAGAPRFMLTFTPETDGDKGFGLILVNVHNYQVVDKLMLETLAYAEKTFPDAQPYVEKIRLGPGGGAAIEARFSGPDPEVLRQLANKAKSIMNQHPDTYAIREDWKPVANLIRPQFDESKARAAGVSRAILSAALEMNFSGTRVGIFREADELLPIIVWQPEKERENVDNIGNVQVWTPSLRRTVPVEQVVTGFETVTEDAYVWRRDRKFTVTAQAENFPGVLTSDIFNTIQRDIEAIPLPTGYEFEWGGEHDDSSSAQAKLMGSMPLTAVLMILIVVMLFNSIKQTLIIWLTVPLALIGVAVGLFAFDQPFDFMSLLGFLALVGMLIKGAIVLIDQINIDLAEGKTPYQAVMDSAVSRMRPVSMAAVTTVLGMIPLLPDTFFRAMAVTIMAGLTFATILTLVVVPVLYTIFYRIPAQK